MILNEAGKPTGQGTPEESNNSLGLSIRVNLGQGRIDAIEKMAEPFSDQLERLSNIDNPIPLKPKDINTEQIKAELKRKSIDVDIINSDSNLKKSIRKRRFRGEDQGRGLAVIGVIGKDGYNEFVAWAQIDSRNQPRLKSKNKDNKKETPAKRKEREQTRRRGEMQLMADIFALASGNMTKEVFCRRTNWCVAMSHKDNPELLKRFEVSTDSIEQKKLKHLSSIPVGSPIRVYQKILSLIPKSGESTNLHSNNQPRTNLDDGGNFDNIRGNYKAAVAEDLDCMCD